MLSLYDSEYFKRQHYADKAYAVKELYYRFLKWANVTDGKGKTALDLGASFGYVVELLKFLGYDATGIDISPYACSKNVTPIVRGDAANIPMKENFFDTITSFETIEHLPESQTAQMLKDVWLSLKPNGTLLLTTPTRFGSTLFRQNKYHPCVKPPQEWAAVIKEIGFRETALLKYVLIPRLLGSYRVLRDTDIISTNVVIRGVK